jgi:hypothetical protein
MDSSIAIGDNQSERNIMRKSFWLLPFLLLATNAFADSVTSQNGPLYFPDGATVTSVTDNAFPLFEPGVAGVYYSFADGTGETFAPPADADVGYLFFTIPITSITFSYVWDYQSFDIVGCPAGPSGCNPSFTEDFSYSDSSGTETINFASNIGEIQWAGSDESAGWGGITSMSYVLDGPDPVPEPNQLILLSIGISLIALTSFRKRLSAR